jgi:hypothetical protein
MLSHFEVSRLRLKLHSEFARLPAPPFTSLG